MFTAFPRLIDSARRRTDLRLAARAAAIAVAGVLILLASPAARRTRAEEPSLPFYKHPKLHTILANLSAAVPQDRSAWAPGSRARMPAGFTPDSMPKPV